MKISYSDIIRKIEPHKDKVFYYPLTENEVKDLEQRTGKLFPDYYREFLKTFGLIQDLVFGLLRNAKAFVKRTNFLPNEVNDSFVLVGDNGGEDYWLLSTDENDINIYEWQHWADGDIVKLEHNFEQLLQESVSILADTSIRHELNENKSWWVEYSIHTNNEEDIYACIPLIKLEDWKLKDVSPADVYCYVVRAELMGKLITFKKQEYAGWQSPSYSFDLRTPVNEVGRNFQIEELDEKLSAAFPRYTLIDYGILGLRADRELY